MTLIAIKDPTIFKFQAAGKTWIVTPSNHPGTIQRRGEAKISYDRWHIAASVEDGSERHFVSHSVFPSVWRAIEGIRAGFDAEALDAPGAAILEALVEAAARQ